MGITLRLLTTLRPSSRVCTRFASRRTARCFMTPKRLRSGIRATISFVVWGRRRSRSRMARRVGSARAFQTASRSSLMTSADSALQVLLERLQHAGPSFAHPVLHVLPHLLRQGAHDLVLEDELRARAGRREPDDQVR